MDDDGRGQALFCLQIDILIIVLQPAKTTDKLPVWSVILHVGARAPTGGVVADVGVRAGAGLVVGENSGEVGVAAHAGEGARGARGVTRLLHPVVPLYESHVVLHQRHVVPHH